jgi:glycosyltransferase involved in cell wall biosynthesis
MGDSRPRVRVFVTTYRRPLLLQRALASLRAQTLVDWVCEVHNDDPADTSPAAVLAELCDPRISLVTHARNLGPLETFNLVFRAPEETYYSLLEDDNWWEPSFLAEMVGTLETRPMAVVAWCNQQIWREEEAGTWRSTGRCVHIPDDSTPRLMQWGDPRQALGALHANGAMLIRSRSGESFPVRGVPFTAVEAIRERLLPHPMVYVSQPLAVYAVTRSSARENDGSDWFAVQCILLATYFRHGARDDDSIRSLWTHYRAPSPAPTNVFLVAALICQECRPLLRAAHPDDWFRLLRSALGHPVSIWRALRVRTRKPDWWTLIDGATAVRWSEVRQAGAQLTQRAAATA